MRKIIISAILLAMIAVPNLIGIQAAEKKVDPAKLQQLGVQMVDKRVTAITKYDGLLVKTKNISQPTLDKVLGELSRVSGDLGTLKTKILGETDATVLKEDIKSIVNNYRVYQVFLPQSAGLVAVDRLLDFQIKLVELSNKISEKANNLEGQGKDVTAIRELVKTAGQLLDAAGDDITTAETAFTSMTISNPEGAKTLKLEGKSALLEAKKNFSEAKKNLKSAVQAIKGLVK